MRVGNISDCFPNVDFDTTRKKDSNMRVLLIFLCFFQSFL